METYIVGSPNSEPVARRLRRNVGGTWSVNVWSGVGPIFADKSARRYTYRTRAEARRADISDAANVLAIGRYLGQRGEL